MTPNCSKGEKTSEKNMKRSIPTDLGGFENGPDQGGKILQSLKEKTTLGVSPKQLRLQYGDIWGYMS